MQVQGCEPSVRESVAGRIGVAIADGNAMFRDAVQQIVSAELDMCAVGGAGTAAEARATVLDHQPDVLLVSLSLTGAIPLVRDMHAREGATMRTIVLVAQGQEAAGVEALQLGAHGVLGRHMGTDALLGGVRMVYQGQYCMESRQVESAVEALRGGASMPARPEAANRYGLTPRELEVVARVMRGDTNRGIAARCGISEDTVKHHLSNIFDKLGVYSRLELALFAVHHQLLASASGGDGMDGSVVPSHPISPLSGHTPILHRQIT
jgi:DNA-binding NarL/FixJ family response regulator